MTARHTRVLVSEVPACVTPTSRLRLIMILSPSSDVDLMRPNFSVPVSSVSLNHLICSDFLGINSRLKRRDFLVKHVHKGREKRDIWTRLISFIYTSHVIFTIKRMIIKKLLKMSTSFLSTEILLVFGAASSCLATTQSSN